MPQELNLIAGWIYHKAASSSLITNFVGKHPTEKVWNIYEAIAIEGATYPIIRYRRVDGHNVNGVGGRRVFDSATYEITVIDEDQTSFRKTGPIADELDRIFRQAQDVEDDLIAGCTSMRAVQRVENIEGIRRNVQGAEFHIMAYSQTEANS